jgi:parallel beta-helix repeat protein
VQLADFRICGDPEAVDAKSTSPKSGMSIDHNGGHGVNLIQCREDPRICDSIITYNAKAGLNIVGGHDIVVNANHFEENQDAVRCIDGFNLCMNGNNVDDHLRHGVVIENTYGSVLSGNMLEECQGTAVVLDRDCYGITISANVIAHNDGGGIDLRDAWGCAVSANTFTIMAVRALVIGPGSGRIAVTGNNFSSTYIGGKARRRGELDKATGIELQGTCDIAISGNVFSGLDENAVQTDGKCRRIAVTGNVMVDLNRRSQKKLPAINLGETKETVVENNIIEKVTEASSFNTKEPE